MEFDSGFLPGIIGPWTSCHKFSYLSITLESNSDFVNPLFVIARVNSRFPLMFVLDKVFSDLIFISLCVVMFFLWLFHDYSLLL